MEGTESSKARIKLELRKAKRGWHFVLRKKNKDESVLTQGWVHGDPKVVRAMVDAYLVAVFKTALAFEEDMTRDPRPKAKPARNSVRRT